MTKKFQLTRRRVLGGMATIGAASAAAGAGTMALFSDQETNSGNTVSAGTLDLTLGGTSSAAITAGPVAPGDLVPSSPATIELTNEGSLEGAEIEVGASITGQNDGNDSEDGGTNRSAADVARRLFVTELQISNSGLGYSLAQLATLIDNPGALLIDSNQVSDTNNSANRRTHMVRAANPAGGGRNGVVHVHSNGNSTDDYAISLRSGFALALGDVTDASGDTPITFDYYGGANNNDSAPDEVYLIINDDSGTDHLVYHAGNDGVPDAQTWKVRDVGEEIHGGTDSLNSGYNWFEVAPDSNAVYPKPGNGGLTASTSSDSNANSSFGSNATIKAVGFGRGTISGGAVHDIYYDNLVVNNNQREFRPMSLYDMAQRTLDRAPGLNAGQTRQFSIQFEFDRLAGNDFQNDGVEFDLEFTLTQEASQ